MSQITYEAKLGEGCNKLFPMPLESLDAILRQSQIGRDTEVSIEVQGQRGQEPVKFKGHIVTYPCSYELTFSYRPWPADLLGPRGYQVGDHVTVTVNPSQS